MKDDWKEITAQDLRDEFGFELAQEYAKGFAHGAAAVQEAFAWPSCWTCRFGIFFEDHSVGIDLHLEDCRRGFGNLTEEQLDNLNGSDFDEEEAASECGCWQPDISSIGNVW